MAHIYAAHDRVLDRPVAIKLLKAELSTDPEFRNRFQQEAKAAANLMHPNIVTIHDFGLDRGRLFIVMEYVPGTDLKSIIRNRNIIPVSEAVALIIQACEGIGYAHRAGIVHCDIKPQNMLVTADQRLKVTDFGIARALASISPDEHNREVWGSPQYFSPEQAAGSAPLPASDVYSLGVVLYEMVTGQLPFSAASPEEYATLHQKAVPAAPSSINRQVPAELEEVLQKVLSKEPARRYRTADQFGHVLQALKLAENEQPSIPAAIEGTTGKTLPALPGTPPSSRDGLSSQMKSVDWVTIGLALLAVAAIGGLVPLWLAVLFQIR